MSFFVNDRDPSRDILMRRVGTHLRAARERKNLSQLDLAREIVGDANTISRWERGLQMPGLEMLMALAAALNIRVADLFVPLEDEPEPNGDEHERAVA